MQSILFVQGCEMLTVRGTIIVHLVSPAVVSLSLSLSLMGYGRMDTQAV